MARIVALHGFLGSGSDWDFLRNAGFDVLTPELDAVPPHGDVLLGYSMGGRLALHALLAGVRYERAVFVSTGLGLEQGREERRVADERWAGRFEHDAWPSLMRDWNAQPVFGGHAVAREERDYDRRSLARALREWSPGVLPPVAGRLHELTLPTLWIAGARDAKYVAEAGRGASLAPAGEVVILEGAGHRVPWEAPGAFIETLRGFVEGVMEG
jgi:2-succinyl-6-hydroxy-2,4-cyclohexadiene-1-carboxylate synthase